MALCVVKSHIASMQCRPGAANTPACLGSGAECCVAKCLPAHCLALSSAPQARKFGVRSAMPGFIARKLCPQVWLLDGALMYHSRRMLLQLCGCPWYRSSRSVVRSMPCVHADRDAVIATITCAYLTLCCLASFHSAGLPCPSCLTFVFCTCTLVRSARPYHHADLMCTPHPTLVLFGHTSWCLSSPTSASMRQPVQQHVGCSSSMTPTLKLAAWMRPIWM
jgi:hypothetical protein